MSGGSKREERADEALAAWDQPEDAVALEESDQEAKPEGELDVGPTRTEKAQMVLKQRFAPPREDRPARSNGAGATWLIQRFHEEWWMWGGNAGLPKYEPIKDELVREYVAELLDQARVWKDHKKKWGPLAPSGRMVMDVADKMISYAAVPAGSEMPCWLPRAFDGKGEPLWRSTIMMAGGKDKGPVPRHRVTAFEDGLLDIEAWCRNEWRLLPPTPRWFARSCLPFKSPEQELKGVDLADDDVVMGVVERLAPTLIAFLEERFEGDEDCASALQEFAGYCLIPDTNMETLLWLPGPSGCGKGVVRTILTACVGKENCAATTFERLAGRFDMANLVGRNIAFIPELRVGKWTDLATALDMLLEISSGGEVSTEQKHQQASPMVSITAKVVITPNEEPPLRDAAAALIRRLLVIPIRKPVEADKVDRTLKARLSAEARGIVLWALVGLKRLLARGHFVQPHSGRETLSEMEETMSPQRVFIQEMMVQQAGSSVNKLVALEMYKDWLTARGDSAAAGKVESSWFGRKLLAAVASVRSRKVELKDGRRVPAYVGIRPRLIGETRDHLEDPCHVEAKPMA